MPTLPPPTIERRYTVGIPGAELRAEPVDGKSMPRLAGIACPWDALSVELWKDWDTGKPVFERFSLGAFAEDLAANPQSHTGRYLQRLLRSA